MSVESDLIADGLTAVELRDSAETRFYDKVIISKKSGWAFCYIDGSDIRDAYPPTQVVSVKGVVEK